MDSFVVSARKYRPLGFAEVVGQEHITTTLKNAIETNKLAQALLFCGPRGIGKTTCARIVARMINGFEETAEINSLNIFELDAASNNSVEDIRNLIDQVRYPPQYGKFKVYIIDEVHMLSNAAFNAFLKTLEEPPHYTLFILATTEKQKVIPTILSRCQIFDFNRIQISDIAKQLKKIANQENVQIEEEALHLIAQKADGALRDGLSIFDLMVTFSSGKKVTFKDVINNLHILDYDYYFQVIDGLLTENHSRPLIILDEILHKGFDGHNFLIGLSEHLRNLLVAQDAQTTTLMEVPESIQNKYMNQAQVTSTSLLLSWLNIANQCDIHYKNSKNQRLSIELALMKMAHVNAVLNIDTITPATEAVKKNLVPEHISSPTENQPPSPTTSIVQSPRSSNELTTNSFPQKKAGSKHKSTLDLNNLLQLPDQPIVSVEQPSIQGFKNTPIKDEELKNAWNKYREKYKNQIAQYHLLNREYTWKESTITLLLNNPIEEPLLHALKEDLIEFLRTQLSNNSIRIEGVLNPTTHTKIAYTNKEKFEQMALKNPLLLQLKDQFRLDTEF